MTVCATPIMLLDSGTLLVYSCLVIVVVLQRAACSIWCDLYTLFDT
jgi:hypothetical protein